MIRLRTGPAALFGAIFVLALILLLPLRFALAWFDLDGTGFAARAASGSVWAGSLREAQLGSIALGDVDAALSPWALLAGRARLALEGHPSGTGRALHGAVSVSRHSVGIEQMTAGVPVGDAFAPLPITAIDLWTGGASAPKGASRQRWVAISPESRWGRAWRARRGVMRARCCCRSSARPGPSK
jgi:general secretion pathway protein N